MIYIVNYNIIMMACLVVDIDECMSNNGGCEQICVNNIGTYSCDCHEGYDIDIDGFSCLGTFINKN